MRKIHNVPDEHKVPTLQIELEDVLKGIPTDPETFSSMWDIFKTVTSVFDEAQLRQMLVTVGYFDEKEYSFIKEAKNVQRNLVAGAQTLEEYCNDFLNRFIFPLANDLLEEIRIFVLAFDKPCYQSGGNAFTQGKRSSKDEFSRFLKVIDTDISDSFL
ncbi:hypothetical protein QYM36_013114 [Artemia franciscana]|uniref:Uncharacterized protein n=1 Tax=Artemia franciscana TaxID=6661 RepID=A0AA88KW13_ARTSF|nr:hypothetical protein QYM36_013114 [Artemia franciscana]